MNEYLSEEQIQELAGLAEKDLLDSKALLDTSPTKETDTLARVGIIISYINRISLLPHVNDYFNMTGLKAVIADGRNFLGKVYALGPVVFISSKGLRVGIADENKNWNEDNGLPLTVNLFQKLPEGQLGNRIIGKLSGFTEADVLTRFKDILKNPEHYNS